MRRPLELALEAAPQANVLLALRGWDGEAALLIQRQVTVRVRVLVWRNMVCWGDIWMKVGEVAADSTRKAEPPPADHTCELSLPFVAPLSSSLCQLLRPYHQVPVRGASSISLRLPARELQIALRSPLPPLPG